MNVYRKLIARFCILAVLVGCAVVRTHATTCQQNCVLQAEECEDQCRNPRYISGQCDAICLSEEGACLAACNGD